MTKTEAMEMTKNEVIHDLDSMQKEREQMAKFNKGDAILRAVYKRQAEALKIAMRAVDELPQAYGDDLS